MIPEGNHGYGWQIMNQIFQDAVSFFASSRRQVGVFDVQNDVSFAKVVKSGLPIVAAGVGISNGASGIHARKGVVKGKETYKDSHAD